MPSYREEEMMGTSRRRLVGAALAVLLVPRPSFAAEPGFVALFNGRDLVDWKVPAGDNGHWKVVDGVIDYDARSEAAGDKHLWSEQAFSDFVLRVEWRIKETPYVNPNVPIIFPDGSLKKGPDGQPVRMAVPDSDSGIYLRGSSKAQVNIWCWPVGSGEVWGYRTDDEMPADVRAGATPKTLADRNVGEWNRFDITMVGERLTVVLNGVKVIADARLPGVPPKGPIALQHHGEWKDGRWAGPPALVQFRNIEVKELGGKP
jgi:3-keto-disaccharide hydrolase